MSGMIPANDKQKNKKTAKVFQGVVITAARYKY